MHPRLTLKILFASFPGVGMPQLFHCLFFSVSVYLAIFVTPQVCLRASVSLLSPVINSLSVDSGELEAHFQTRPRGVLQQAEGGGRGSLGVHQ